MVGDVHPGDNPLGQALFGLRHPDPARFRRMLRDEAGGGLPVLLPPFGAGIGLDARGVAITGPDDVHIAMDPESVAPDGLRTWRAAELLVDGGEVVDRGGTIRLRLIDVLALPVFIMAVRTFAPWDEPAHASRLSVGRVVLRREHWTVTAADVPAADGMAAWAAGLGMPRRVFVTTPVERKPFLLDVESPVLRRIAARHIRAAAAVDGAATVRMAEMLPAPEGCWLRDDAGRGFTSELRFVGRDRRRGRVGW